MTEATQPALAPRCRFCDIIAGAEEVTQVAPGIVLFPALEPGVPGHLLVAPVLHVTDALESPRLTGRVFDAAAQVARRLGGACNLVTNAGAEAGQKVFHLHVHILPRTSGEALTVPDGEHREER